MVTSAKGKEYSSDSTQGKVIVRAKADAAAKAAASSQTFSTDSSSLESIKPIFENMAGKLTAITEGVSSIGENVTSLVTIQQADTRGDALNKSNVPQDDLTPAPGASGGGGMSDNDLAAQQDENSALGGLGGIAGFIGGLGKSMSFWGSKKAMIGVPVFLLFLAGLTAVAKLGAMVFSSSAETIAEGMETLSNADVDTDKVIQLGKALALFGGAMAAEGIGKGIGSLGSLVSGIADGFAGFLGIEKKDPMVALKAFAQHEITEKEVKQIELNAKALSVFSVAMAVNAGADFATSVGNLASGVVSFVAGFLPAKEDPMLKMIEFAGHEITQKQVDQIKLNSAALVGFSTVMATVKAIGVVEDIADLASGVVNFVGSFFPKGSDPMVDMKKFAETKITQAEADQIILNSKALIAFAPTMAIAKVGGAAGDIASMFGGIANGISSLFGIEKADPMADMKKFAETKITQVEADQIALNAGAIVKFSTAMALYSASGAVSGGLDLLGGMAKGITNFFGGTVGIDYKEIKKFAESGIGEYEEAVTKNAAVLKAFSSAMSSSAKDDVKTSFINIGANILGAIGSIFGGKPEDKIPYDEITTFASTPWTDDTKTSIVRNAEILTAFSLAMGQNASAQAEGGWANIKANFLGAVGSIFGAKPEDNIPYEKITTFAAMPWTEDTTKKITANAATLHAYTTAIAKMSSLKQEEGFWSSIGSSLSGAFSALLGQDSLPIEEIQTFTAIDLDLKKVNNNISAIEAFMNFGTRMKDWTGSDMGGLDKLGSNMAAAAQGMYVAMYGGVYRVGNNITVKPGQALTNIDTADFTSVSTGVNMLRTAFTGAGMQTQQLQTASAEMDASTGGITTVVNANNNSTNNTASQSNTYSEMSIDHDESSGSIFSKVIDFVF